MRKLLLCFLCLSCLVSCEKEDMLRVNETLLLGEWVYDHPEVGVWEKQKFMNSGIFYYSNDVRGDFSFSNDQNNGSYRMISDNQVECSFYLHNVATTVTMTIQKITDYSYTAEYFDGESLGVFTYSRLLASHQMERGEKLTPDYKSLVKTDILGYKSHNTNIITVDNNTGEITAVAPGVSYVDVLTNEGTAVVEITIATDLWPDYTQMLGKTLDEVEATFGTLTLLKPDGYYMIYDNEFIYFAYFSVDPDTHKVFGVRLLVKDDCDWQIPISYLDYLYYYYEKGSDKDKLYYAYTNNRTLDTSNIGIVFNGESGIISYLDLLYDINK